MGRDTMRVKLLESGTICTASLVYIGGTSTELDPVLVNDLVGTKPHLADLRPMCGRCHKGYKRRSSEQLQVTSDDAGKDH